MPGFFVSFEGLDGSGKSLMLDKAAAMLQERGYQVLCTREPGGSRPGRQMRQIVLDSPYGTLDPRGEALLFAADRAVHVAQVIRPALARGEIVLCDRYVDSSYAYQGGGREMDIDQVRALNRFATYGLLPDVTFLLDLPAEIALSRLGKSKDRIEQESLDFFRHTARAYRQLAAAEPQRFCLIDATVPVEEESRLINRLLLQRLTSPQG